MRFTILLFLCASLSAASLFDTNGLSEDTYFTNPGSEGFMKLGNSPKQTDQSYWSYSTGIEEKEGKLNIGMADSVDIVGETFTSASVKIAVNPLFSRDGLVTHPAPISILIYGHRQGIKTQFLVLDSNEYPYGLYARVNNSTIYLVKSLNDEPIEVSVSVTQTNNLEDSSLKDHKVTVTIDGELPKEVFLAEKVPSLTGRIRCGLAIVSRHSGNRRWQAGAKDFRITADDWEEEED